MNNRLAVVTSSAAVLFVLATGALLLRHRSCPHYHRRFLSTILARSYSPGPDVEFKWRMSGSGTTKDGARFDDSEYVSTDCASISVIYYTFPSAETAGDRVTADVKAARTVYPNDMNRKGVEEPDDERTVLLARPSGNYEVLRRTGNRLLQIESSSLNHALEYERRLTRGTTAQPN
jgi:hypothetical protein